MVPPPPPPPPPLPPPLCTLPPGPGPPRFICYCEEEKAAGASGEGGFSLYVTDAAELWSTCFTPDGLAALKARFGLSAAEDVTPRFRAAFKQQAVTFTPQEDAASLTLSGGPSTLDFELSKVPGPEAAPRLQALTLRLAERVCSLERQLACRIGGWAPAAPPGPPCPCLHAWLSPQLWRRRPPAPGRALGQWGLSSSYQIQILREAALDLGSGGGVPASPSSTLASKVRNQPVVWILMTSDYAAKKCDPARSLPVRGGRPPRPRGTHSLVPPPVLLPRKDKPASLSSFLIK